MDRFVYLNIVKIKILPFAEQNMLEDWIYMADNHPKHSRKVEKTFLNNNKISIMKWSVPIIGSKSN